MPTIRVKKPFEPDPSASPKPTLPVAMQETNAVEINPEFEEKPVVDSVSKTSEEYHGGSELSFSMPDTSVSSPIPMPFESSNSSSSSYSSEQPESTSSSPTSSETPKTEQQSSGQSQPEPSSQQSSEERPESSSPSLNQQSEQQSISSSSESQQQSSPAPETTETSSTEQSSQMPEATKTLEQTSESSASTATEQQLGSSEESTTETSAQESSEPSVSTEQPSTNNSVATESAEQSNAQQGTELQANEQTNAEEEGEEDKEEDEDNDDSEEDKNQAYSYTFNTQQAFDVTDYVDATTKYYQTMFYRFIEMIAEEKTKFFDPSGSEEYNIKKLMFRAYEKKPLQHYRMARVREAIVLLLDNSGSMKWWAKNLQVLAELAMKRNDVEVYLAPNGIIEEMLHPKREKVSHDDVVKKLRNRKIIYVGDFDGANTPIELSWYNDVIWICPESRYKHFMEHDWVSYSEDKFKGAFLRVFTLEQMFSAFRKLLSSPSLKIWYDLFDEYVQEDEDEDMS